MSDYQKQIAELERSISEREGRLNTMYATVGRYARENRDDVIEQKRVRTKAKEAASKQKEFEEASAQAARLEHLQNRRQEIQEQIADAQNEVDRLSEEIRPLCEEVGKAAFKTYKENPIVDPAIEEIFSSLLEHQDELKELERQIGDQESGIEEQSAVGKLMSRGRLAFLKGKKSARENALPRLYREAGEAVCSTNFVNRMEDPGLSKAAKPYFTKRADIEELEQNVQSLEDEKRQVAAELSELAGGVGAERRLRRTKEAVEEELREIDRAIGEKAHAALGDDPDLPEEVRSAMDEIATEQEKIADERDHLRRLKAAVEADEVQESISKLEDRISSVEEEITERQKKLDELKTDLENAKSEHRRLEKSRGPVEDL